ELVDAGSHCFPFFIHEIERIFEVDPYQLEIMRVDLAADVPGISVLWFLTNGRVNFKRFSNAGTGNFEYQQQGQRGPETLYYGKKPNCYRIYNKIREYEHQYRKLARAAGEGEIPSFETMFGLSQDNTLTRVERQSGGGRIPHEIH